jgi:hypothetical protein
MYLLIALIKALITHLKYFIGILFPTNHISFKDVVFPAQVTPSRYYYMCFIFIVVSEKVHYIITILIVLAPLTPHPQPPCRPELCRSEFQLTGKLAPRHRSLSAPAVMLPFR